MYCKAPINYVDGKKVYGNLPPNTVVAYELDGYGYFEIVTDQKFPPDSDVTYISESDYKLAINTLNQQVAQRRQQDQELINKMLAEREQRIADVEIAIAELAGKINP